MSETALSAVPIDGESEERRDGLLTIDELARETHYSTRNIRSYQARGLLPPPEVHMRIGYYGPEHLARLRLIRELQDEGLKLDGIKRLLAESNTPGEGLLRVRQAADADVEAPEVVSLTDLVGQFGVEGDEAAKMLAKAEHLGVLVPISDGVYEVPSPALLEAAREVVRLGIGMPAALDVIEVLSVQSRNGAHRFVKLFLKEVWEPFAKSGMPEDEWPAIAEAMERTRPLAAQAMLALFRQAMRTEVDGAFADIAKRLSEGKR